MKINVASFFSFSALFAALVTHANPAHLTWESAYADAVAKNDKRALFLLQDRYDALPAGVEKLYISSKLHGFMLLHGQPYFGNNNANAIDGKFATQEKLFINALNSEEQLNFISAREGYLSLLEDVELSNSINGKILFEYHLCRVLNRQALYHQADIYCSSLNTHIQDVDQPILPKYLALRVIANNQEFLGHYPLALDTYQQLLSIIPDYEDASGIYNDAGLLLANLGSFTQAEEYINKALKIREQLSQPLKLAQTHHSMGKVKLKQSEYSSAITHFSQSKHLSQRLNYPYGVTFADLGLGEAYIGTGNFEVGTSHLLAALDNATKQDNAQIRGEIYLALARTHKEQNKYIAAHDFAEHAHSLGKNVASERLSAQALALLAEISEHQKNYDKALGYYREYAKSELQKRDKDNANAFIALESTRRDNESKSKVERLEHQNSKLIAENALLGKQLMLALLSVFTLAFIVIALMFYYNRKYAQLSWDAIGKALNRSSCIEKVKAQKAPHLEHYKNVLILLDLDNFKAVNNKFGHHLGDQLLRDAVKNIAKHLKSGDFIGRLGGEELLVLLKEVDEIDVEFRVQQLHSAIAHGAPQTNNFQPVSLSASCSYLATSKALSDFNELYAILDQALCQIKRKGNNQIIDAFNAPIYPTTDDSPTEACQQEMPSPL